MYKTDYASPIGNIMLASDGKSLVGAWVEGQKYFAQSVNDDFCENDNPEIFKHTKDWLNRYFAGLKPDIS